MKKALIQILKKLLQEFIEAKIEEALDRKLGCIEEIKKENDNV